MFEVWWSLTSPMSDSIVLFSHILLLRTTVLKIVSPSDTQVLRSLGMSNAVTEITTITPSRTLRKSCWSHQRSHLATKYDRYLPIKSTLILCERIETAQLERIPKRDTTHDRERFEWSVNRWVRWLHEFRDFSRSLAYVSERIHALTSVFEPFISCRRCCHALLYTPRVPP